MTWKNKLSEAWFAYNEELNTTFDLEPKSDLDVVLRLIEFIKEVTNEIWKWD